jgi:hypothetical protein
MASAGWSALIGLGNEMFERKGYSAVHRIYARIHVPASETRREIP